MPVLGICYGLQLIAHLLGGKVERGAARASTAHARVVVEKPEGIFHRFAKRETLDVWMSHGDRIAALPAGLPDHRRQRQHAVLRRRQRRSDASTASSSTPRSCTRRAAREILAAFLFDVAGLAPTWTPGSFTEEAVADRRARRSAPTTTSSAASPAGSTRRSPPSSATARSATGSRASSSTTACCARARPSRSSRPSARRFHLNLVAVDARERFLTALAGVTDPSRSARSSAASSSRSSRRRPKKVDDAQAGSCRARSTPTSSRASRFKGPSAVIKSHHNVGGLPERMKLKLIEPLRELFKDEVRAAGDELGMPQRHALAPAVPRPGPRRPLPRRGHRAAPRGAARRRRHRRSTRSAPPASTTRIWQAFAVLLPVRERRRHGRRADVRGGVRACARSQSVDGMTADWAKIPYEVLGAHLEPHHQRGARHQPRRLDITTKPPGTIEWE